MAKTRYRQSNNRRILESKAAIDGCLSHPIQIIDRASSSRVGYQSWTPVPQQRHEIFQHTAHLSLRLPRSSRSESNVRQECFKRFSQCKVVLNSAGVGWYSLTFTFGNVYIDFSHGDACQLDPKQRECRSIHSFRRSQWWSYTSH